MVRATQHARIPFRINPNVVKKKRKIEINEGKSSSLDFTVKLRQYVITARIL